MYLLPVLNPKSYDGARVLEASGRLIGKKDGAECRWCGEGYEDGDHIVFRCEEIWRPEAKRGQKWRTWEDLDDKRWIVLVPKVGGNEGEMEEED